jgi:hypothetical protein
MLQILKFQHSIEIKMICFGVLLINYYLFFNKYYRKILIEKDVEIHILKDKKNSLFYIIKCHFLVELL